MVTAYSSLFKKIHHGPFKNKQLAEIGPRDIVWPSHALDPSTN